MAERRAASPQVEEGHVQIANELYEAIIALRCPGRVKDLLLAVIREVYGWNSTKRVVSRRKLGQLLSGDLGKPANERHVRQLIAEAEAWNLIERDGRELSIQKDYKRWRKPEKRTSGFGNRRGLVPGNDHVPVPRSVRVPVRRPKTSTT